MFLMHFIVVIYFVNSQTEVNNYTNIFKNKKQNMQKNKNEPNTINKLNIY